MQTHALLAGYDKYPAYNDRASEGAALYIMYYKYQCAQHLLIIGIKMNIAGNNGVTVAEKCGNIHSATCPSEAWVIHLKGDGDDCLNIHKIVVGDQATVADWIRTFLTSHMETIERLAGSPIEIKVRATTVDTVQGIASTADGMAYVQVRAMLFNVEVAA